MFDHQLFSWIIPAGMTLNAIWSWLFAQAGSQMAAHDKLGSFTIGKSALNGAESVSLVHISPLMFDWEPFTGLAAQSGR
jgi:hypothetical protein